MIYLLTKWERKGQSDLARMLLAYGVKREYDILELPEIQYAGQGKPFFPGEPEIHFNYSHCSQGILCGIHSSEIGVDMERIISYKEHLARRICHQNELELLEKAVHKDNMLTRIWTCKESYLKYTGRGIRSDLRLLDCSGCIKGSFELNGRHILSGLQEHYGFAVCCRGEIGEIKEVRWEELLALCF